MAKKNRDTEESMGSNGSESVGSRIGTFFLVIIIIIVWLAIFALLVKMDIGGMGTRLRPIIKDVPVLNQILPAVPDEVLIAENAYPYSDISEAVAVIKQLEQQVEELDDTNSDYAKRIVELEDEVARLQVFEDEQEAFEERVKRFDVNVVYNSQAPDISEYKSYYEEINPDTAEEIYRQVVEQLQYDDAIQEKADLLKNMKPAQAASILEEMTADLEYSCKLLLCMKTDEATAILNKMDTLFAARILQTMHDMDDAWYEKIQSNLLDLQGSDSSDTAAE